MFSPFCKVCCSVPQNDPMILEFGNMEAVQAEPQKRLVANPFNDCVHSLDMVFD